jgi:hypothetical protein
MEAILKRGEGSMNWGLIFKLSLFGLAMGVATVYAIPSTIEPICWLTIFVVCAAIIARTCTRHLFWHGFFTSLVNCVWITGTHILFFQDYLQRHAQEAAMMAKMPMPGSPRLMMLMTGPVIGVVSGVVLGLFALLAGLAFKKRAKP